MQLSAATIKNISANNLDVPGEDLLQLPEKILQFGTGVLLRGLPDYFIEKANRMGIFNGRVVVVKSTSRGDTGAFDKQDGLYTLCVRGLVNGKKVEENIINSSISRVLTASHEWEHILQCAHNESLQVIISNTTEVGIKLVNEDIRRHPPGSFPGKLLAFLFERFNAFGGSDKSGFVIIPTELIPDNGKKLRSIVLELAHLNALDEAFIEWLEASNYFCSSLVDRIVTGTPEENVKTQIEAELGYNDDLLTVCEVYRLWAIEGDEHIKKVLSFAAADEGMIIEPDIELYRELKLRLLNAPHTLSCGIAFLAGIATVKEGMEDEMMARYVIGLMKHEIAPSMAIKTEKETKDNFIANVLDRFRNPHVNHYWKSITLNYTQKMRMRCIPLLLNYVENENAVPELFALGFAAYLRFMKIEFKDGNKYYGELNGDKYLVDDEMAEKFYHTWHNSSPEKVVMTVLKDSSLWGSDLSELTGFQQSVAQKLLSILGNSMRAELKNLPVKKSAV